MRLNLANLKTMKPDMTIGELVDSIEKKNKEQEEKNVIIRKTVIDHYTGKYIKIHEENGIFGESLEIYKIDSIKSVGYDTDYNELYGITGTKISFSKRDLAKYEIKGDCGNSFSYKDLQQSTLIQYEHYVEYLDEYNKITTTLKNLIDEQQS
jgi:hypothetical protein